MGRGGQGERIRGFIGISHIQVLKPTLFQKQWMTWDDLEKQTHHAISEGCRMFLWRKIIATLAANSQLKLEISFSGSSDHLLLLFFFLSLAQLSITAICNQVPNPSRFVGDCTLVIGWEDTGW